MKAITFLLSLLPLGYSLLQIYLLQSGAENSLGADPGKALVHLQGEWTIRFLMLTLLITPLRQLTGWTQLIRVRRMLGLFTFFYASLHLTAYLVFLLELNFSNLWADVLKRPYITIGFTAFVLLIPMAVTSTDAMVRRLRRRWQQLHRVVYVVAVLAVLHLVWLAKSSYAEAALYGSLIAVLLVCRPLGRWLESIRRSFIFRNAIKTEP